MIVHSEGVFRFQNIWDFSGYHISDAEIARSDFVIESSNTSERFLFEDFVEEIKSLATVKFTLSFEINNFVSILVSFGEQAFS